jgi:ribonuclease-3
MSPIPKFNNQKLLQEALTHRSFLNENKSLSGHNERLEFLGDAVLELAVSQYLFETFTQEPEGTLTAYRSSLVKTQSLASVAQNLALGQMLHMSKGEELSGGRTNQSLLANTFEAVLGALYLDQGFEVCVTFLQTHLFPQLTTIIHQGSYRDHKSMLQEKVQAQGFPSPSYTVIKEEGPDHNKEFTVKVRVGDQDIVSGSGKSKQLAQQDAARQALEILKLS